ncbi:MAG: CHAT domain-containing protein, partial [Planctomycetes bacterium]|nr:CHAT domain-containing protein [Planctomycetota bacterium]
MLITLDFCIRTNEEGHYHLEIFERGKSQPSTQTSFSYDLSYITQFEINRLEPDSKDPYGRMERLREFGKKLYDKLFTHDVQKLWADYKQKSGFLVLCLRLAAEANGLEVLPWETLYDGSEFIAAGAKTGLSRLPLDVQIQDELPAVPLPLKMLALLSSPLDLKENERLEIEREQEILLQAVNAPSGQGKIFVEFEDEAKLPIIESNLEGGCQIFHYSGHGIPPEDGGGLLLEDSQGNKRPTKVSELLQILEKTEKDLRLAVIFGCQTAKTGVTLNISGFRDLARGLLRRGIPAVIAMQFSISDNAGLLFAENLYPRLIEGQSLDVAISGSRRSLLQSDDVRIQTDAFAPVLFASNNQPLRTKEPETSEIPAQPKIDFSFHLPLPQLSFGFYGRRKEYRAIRDGLLRKNHRAIIVHGIGGIGKTALASHAATRLRKHFSGVYAFDCTSAALAPETILLELHRYLERQGITTLQQLLHQSIPPDQLATFIAQVLSQLSLLVIFDNFETHLAAKNDSHEIADENLGTFLKTLIKTTAKGSHFLFTSRYLFDVDARRIGTITELSLADLSRPEALGLMQKLPHLSKASFADQLRAFDTFGGHPYALVTVDRHCGYTQVSDVLKDASKVRTELREFLAIELSYAKLSNRSRELLNRLAAFRKPVHTSAAEWVMADKVEKPKLPTDIIKKLDRERMPQELRGLSDEELLRFLQKNLPDQRRADLGKEIAELIRWGLLTPLYEDEKVGRLALHSLVRDFCKDKLKREIWKHNLRGAASYYTNSTKLVPPDKKSPLAVWTDMEAFELLFEGSYFEEGASLLFQTSELLARWGFGVYLESVYRRILP